jgi:hypothetical protein
MHHAIHPRAAARVDREAGIQRPPRSTRCRRWHQSVRLSGVPPPADTGRSVGKISGPHKSHDNEDRQRFELETLHLHGPNHFRGSGRPFLHRRYGWTIGPLLTLVEPVRQMARLDT